MPPKKGAKKGGATKGSNTNTTASSSTAGKGNRNKSKKGGRNNNNNNNNNNNVEEEIERVSTDLEWMSIKDDTAKDRATTGVLTSQPLSRDVKIENFSLSFHGRELISNTTIELNFGRRYGLIGANGTGKSQFLRCLANREVPFPEHIDIYHLNEEAPPSDLTAVQAVIDHVVKQQQHLEAKAERLAMEGAENVQELLDDIYERLDELDPSTFESRACELLHGLGFSANNMRKMTKDMSGGWRMRVALARALFIRPDVLLLDEPTNHLDLGACVWLEEYLKTYNRILVIVSHSQDFLNGVCTNIMHLHRTKLVYYGGNYSTYVKTREEREVNQMKAYEKQQNDIEHIKKFIASCGTYANLVRQAKSKQKIIDKMEAAGLVEIVKPDPVFRFRFTNAGKLPPPVVSFDNVSFSYSGDLRKDALYKNLDFGVDMDSRVALVGPNGAGKSTLLKLMMGDLSPTEGRVTRHGHLRIGRYNQHSADQLDLDLSPVEYFRKKFEHLELEVDEWRQKIGQFGLTGNAQMNPIRMLSDGLKSRIVFAELAIAAPHMLLLDEPTNHLDLECIDSLAEAINHYDGGVVLVSHDFRLINQVANQIWVCSNGTITHWNDDIQNYKTHLKNQMKIA